MSHTASHAFLDDNLACSDCGYNLRGLDRGGLCPECGGSIHASWLKHVRAMVDPYGIAAATPHWLWRFHTGLRIGTWAGLAMLIASAADHLLQLTEQRRNGSPMTIVALVKLVSIAAMFAGAFFTLAGRDVPQTRVRVQRLALWGLGVFLVVVLGIMLIAAFSQDWGLVKGTSIAWSLAVVAFNTLYWLYVAIWLPNVTQRVLIRVLAVLMLIGMVASLGVDPVEVSTSHYYSTFLLPVVSGQDALLIALRSVSYSRQLSPATSVYLIAGCVSLAMLAMMYSLSSEVRRARRLTLAMGLSGERA